MSETKQTDPMRFSGDRDAMERWNRLLDELLHNADDRDPAALIAVAVRAGLAEIAVEISSIRGFGVGQNANRG